MHLYLLTRGIKHEIDRFVNDMQAQYFPFKHQGKDTFVQLAMRPIQLWEIVFPEPELHNVLKTIFPEGLQHDDGLFRKLQLTALRKMLKAEKMPKKIDEKALGRMMYNNSFIAKYPVGIKKDNYKDGSEEL